jgi:hypothetical protein
MWTPSSLCCAAHPSRTYSGKDLALAKFSSCLSFLAYTHNPCWLSLPVISRLSTPHLNLSVLALSVPRLFAPCCSLLPLAACRCKLLASHHRFSPLIIPPLAPRRFYSCVFIRYHHIGAAINMYLICRYGLISLLLLTPCRTCAHTLHIAQTNSRHTSPMAADTSMLCRSGAWMGLRLPEFFRAHHHVCRFNNHAPIAAL